jgi:bacterioferritin-associated ferredoxin
MSNESQLQREFKERDVQRMRNIITKDYTAKTTTQIGYSKINVEHKEGDVWEEQGKQWTIKNGIKQTVTRFDKLKESVVLPLTCPKCNRAMKNISLNKKMWPIHKTCFDCVVEMETELKRTGQYDAYVRDLTTRGIKAYVKDLEDAMLEIALMESNEGFVTEAGDVEKWAGKGLDTQKMTEELQEYIQKIKDHISS